MTTLSDLREVKEALDAGLVSQAEYDDVKRDYLRAQKEAVVEFQRRELLAKEEFQKKALRAKDDALEANKECQKMELRAKKEALDAYDAYVKTLSELRTAETAKETRMKKMKASRIRNHERELRSQLSSRSTLFSRQSRETIS